MKPIKIMIDGKPSKDFETINKFLATGETQIKRIEFAETEKSILLRITTKKD